MVQRSQQRTTVLLIPKTCQFLRQQLVFQTWLMDAESTRTQRGKLWKASPNNPQTPQTYCTYSILFYCFFCSSFFFTFWNCLSRLSTRWDRQIIEPATAAITPSDPVRSSQPHLDPSHWGRGDHRLGGLNSY